MSRTTIQELAHTIADILRTDRYAVVVCTGDPGEGKSCITAQLAKEVSKSTNTPFSYEQSMTYQRKELKTWIDGDKDGNDQKPEYSTVLADELVSMFFKRNWYDSEQIDGIELLNKCRDRHLCIIGNIPNFWDLDSAIYSLVTFWIHVPVRGLAWVFKKDHNPFAVDKWHRVANEKKFRKSGRPYGLPGYVCELRYNDWSPEDKDHYYSVRNEKRKRTEGQRAKNVKYRDIKIQRDELIRFIFSIDKELTNKALHDLIPSLSAEAIRLIRIKER